MSKILACSNRTNLENGLFFLIYFCTRKKVQYKCRELAYVKITRDCECILGFRLLVNHLPAHSGIWVIIGNFSGRVRSDFS